MRAVGELLGHVVLGDAPEAVRVFGHAGHRQQLVDAARGDDQAVEAERAPAAVRVEPAHGVPVEVYYETVALILAFILLGNMFEARAKKRRAQ